MTPLTEAYLAFLTDTKNPLEQESRRKLVKALCSLSGVGKLIDAPDEDQPHLMAVLDFLTGKRAELVQEPVEGYEPLARILALAYDQSAKGKGKERHANAKPFDKQPIMEIGRMLGSVCDGEMYQVIKKVQEASNMVARGNASAAKAELLGAIVYSAAAYLLIEESEHL